LIAEYQDGGNEREESQQEGREGEERGEIESDCFRKACDHLEDSKVIKRSFKRNGGRASSACKCQWRLNLKFEI